VPGLKITITKLFTLIFSCLYLHVQEVKAASVVFNQLESELFLSDKRIYSTAFDNDGFLWFAMKSKIWRFDGNSYKNIVYSQNQKITKIKKIHFDRYNNLWIGTENNGVFKYNGHSTQNLTIENSSINSNLISALASGDNENLWIGTNNGLNLVLGNTVTSYPLINKQGLTSSIYITSILHYSKDKLLIGSKKGLYLFNKKTGEYRPIDLTGRKENFIVYTIYKDTHEKIWIGTQKGIFETSDSLLDIRQYQSTLFDYPITSINIDESSIWIGTLSEGLFRVSKENGDIDQFLSNSHLSTTISDNSIISMIEHGNLLWINTFSGGLNYINKETLKFGLNKSLKNNIGCAKSNIFTQFVLDKKSILWVATENGLLKINTKTGNCSNYFLDLNSENAFDAKYLRALAINNNNDLWLGTTKGLNKLNFDSKLIDTSYESIINQDVFFIRELENSQLLVGTIKGLYLYDTIKNEAQMIESNTPLLTKSKFYSSSTNEVTKHIYMATNNGVMILNNGRLSLYEKVQSQLPTKLILSIHLDNNQHLFIGTELNGFYVFDTSGVNISQRYNKNVVPNDLNIYSIMKDDESNFWMGTDSGLLKIDHKTNDVHVFHESDGLQGERIGNTIHKTNDGMLYVGGNNGFNAFYANEIKLNTTPPNIALTDFTRFGQSVEIGKKKNGFLLEKDINQLDELTLGHKDYVIGFEFAALDFADPARNKYAYKMEGLDPDWIYTNATNRRISYSNLRSGQYTFRVKGSNKDGTWNNVGKSLKVIVNPAPWLSWWAYTLYFIAAYYLISWYFKKKNRENQKLTNMLKVEVAQQTKELKQQKQTVEDLLIKKNELFANISHEFRTPLTLILGPIDELLKSNFHHSDVNKLKMVNRNANRLLTMIEQLLQLAKVTSDENIQFYQIKTKVVIATLVDSFAILAAKKNIKLYITGNENAAIKTSKDALEIVLGNLLSNAIKYTQQGGKVSVGSTQQDDKVSITVTDTGCGLDEQQQKDIFNRFKRLKSHQNIDGIGIGLSVVEEVLKINNASINIKSKQGQGSTFTICFDAIEMVFEESTETSDTQLIKQLTSENAEPKQSTNDTQNTSKNKESILIIEDNHDMRTHITNTLKNNYHCLQADRGKTGIALAIKHVPDIIICDVMMPEMDGFHVSRMLRNDTRTSHIPLMLLTALDDRESRIRGWREHVDVYLTKPFDAQELLLQLENILIIRNILKNKNRVIVKAGKSTPINIDLPKKDQEFINKLNKLIAKNYKNPLYLRANLASDMAVSERQLQRKIKALINRNPMGLLREYRLSQAAKMLKDGFQVSISSDECGFNSLSNFSKCFKSQFGLSPKAYQITCKN